MKIKIENPLRAEAKKSAGIKNEMNDLDDDHDHDQSVKNSLKKVRSCDVLKSDDLGKIFI